ncbi:MAG: ATP-binding protein [Desulfobulbaceae bacterium]|nr:ATP-binding protein [Desulfobulbaceae bacterium]
MSLLHPPRENSSRPPAQPFPPWLLPLRWGGFIHQALLLAIIHLFFAPALPLSLLAAMALCHCLGNLIFFHLSRRGNAVPAWLLGVAMLADILLLTALLHGAGGLPPPSAFLYLAPITIAAILLDSAGRWLLTAFALLCYGTLPLAAHPASGAATPILHWPHWLTFALTAAAITLLAGWCRALLQSRQEQIDSLGQENATNQMLAVLTADATHELSTPLGIIAVAADESLRYINDRQDEPDLREDLILIREQIGRCRAILDRMASPGGKPGGEPCMDVDLRMLLINTLQDFTAEEQERIHLIDETGALTIRVPRLTFGHALKGVVKNGLDATGRNGSVIIHCRRNETDLSLAVEDRGGGMDRETMARATEPLFTTKPPGMGLGLGLFLAKALTDRFEGDLRIRSEEGEGTTVTLSLPLKNIKERASK